MADYKRIRDAAIPLLKEGKSQGEVADILAKKGFTGPRGNAVTQPVISMAVRWTDVGAPVGKTFSKGKNRKKSQDKDINMVDLVTDVLTSTLSKKHKEAILRSFHKIV